MIQQPAAVQLVVREYQARAVQAFGGADPNQGAMWVMATGTGKTVTGHLLVAEYARMGKRVVWLAHREELIRQPYKTLCRWWPELVQHAGVVKAASNGCMKRIVYASKDTLYRPNRMAQVLAYGKPDLLIVDEAHVSASDSYKKVIDQLTGPNTRVLGLTATPDREDGERLSDRYKVVFSYSILDALADGALLPPYRALDEVPDLDMSKVGGRKDYTEAESERELMRVEIVKHTVASLERAHLAQALPFHDRTEVFDLTRREGGTLVFTATIRQAELTAEALRERGWKAEPISGETPKAQRARLLEQFESGEVEVLCNAAVLTTGTDLPIAHCIVLARPTKSWALFVQMVGRALRPHEGQTKALVLDLVGATKFHSIIAAPVLIDGTDCEGSADGQHRYLELSTGEGRCQNPDCGHMIKCFARLGGHLWKDGICKACGATQCEANPTAPTHKFVDWEDKKRKCAWCGLEIPDPTRSMKASKPDREAIAWKELSLPGTTVRIRGANLGKVGVIYDAKHGDQQYMPFWWDGKELHQLARELVPKVYSEALLDDVARRASRVESKRGGRRSAKGYRVAYFEAERIAIKLRLWERR